MFYQFFHLNSIFLLVFGKQSGFITSTLQKSVPIKQWSYLSQIYTIWIHSEAQKDRENCSYCAKLWGTEILRRNSQIYLTNKHTITYINSSNVCRAVFFYWNKSLFCTSIYVFWFYYQNILNFNRMNAGAARYYLISSHKSNSCTFITIIL